MKIQAFVMMPFSKEFVEVRESIRSAGKITGVKMFFVDESDNTGDITPEIKAEIKKSHFCIADISGKNPSVAWEYGHADALNKKVIPLARSENDFFFDVKDQRAIIYDPENLEVDVKQNLITRINQIKKEITHVAPEILIGSDGYEKLTAIAAAKNVPDSRYGFFETIPMAKEHIFIAAQNHFFFIRDEQNRRRFENSVVKFLTDYPQAKFDVLMCDEKVDHAIRTWEFVVDSKLYRSHLNAAVTYFGQLEKRINEIEALDGRFNVKKIDFVPLSANFIDPESSNGLAVLVPNTFETRNTSRPCYVISKSVNPDIFQEYWSTYYHWYTSLINLDFS